MHCSVTGIRSRLLPGALAAVPVLLVRAQAGLEQQPVGGRRRPAHLFHTAVAACFHPVPPATVPVSGAPAVGPLMPPIARLSLNLKMLGSQNMFSLSRGETCAVRRSVGWIVPGALLFSAGG